MRILPQVFTFSPLPVNNVLSFSSVSKMLWFPVFWTAYWKFLEKSIVCQLYHLLGIHTDPYRPDPVRHAVDASPYPDLAKWCESVPIRIFFTYRWDSRLRDTKFSMLFSNNGNLVCTTTNLARFSQKDENIGCATTNLVCFFQNNRKSALNLLSQHLNCVNSHFFEKSALNLLLRNQSSHRVTECKWCITKMCNSSLIINQCKNYFVSLWHTCDYQRRP
jgi:hypothetical protein